MSEERAERLQAMWDVIRLFQLEDRGLLGDLILKGNDKINLCNRLLDCADASRAPGEASMSEGTYKPDALTTTARKNIRTFVNGATFKSTADMEAAVACLDVLDQELDGLGDLVTLLRGAIRAMPASPPAKPAPADGPWTTEQARELDAALIQVARDRAGECGATQSEMREARAEFLRDWLNNHMSVPADGWLPIETAPKDGSEILGFGLQWGWSPVRFVCVWNGATWYAGWGDSIQPTHWMPLPAAPALSTAQGEA